MHATVRELKRRLVALPEVLSRVAAAPLPDGLASLASGSVLFTGVGMSACVAHFAEAVFRHELRIRVNGLPLSSFVSEDVKAQGESLVLVSQGLSPNARLALARAGEFARVLLVTAKSCDEARAAGLPWSATCWTLPLEAEEGFLTRVQGPLASALAVLRLGWHGAGRAPPDELASLPEAVSAALTRGLELAKDWPLEVRRAPLLATGWYARCLELFAWAWMETWWVEPPPAWDVLQTAHGPWQQWSTRPETLLALERPDDVPGLWPRLKAMLSPVQRLVPLPATLPAPWAWFEHAAQVLGLLVGVLERSPVDLSQWPGRGGDAPLYDFGR
jgi:creatinine amidohydrolase